jgi:hypothetical protein
MCKGNGARRKSNVFAEKLRQFWEGRKPRKSGTDKKFIVENTRARKNRDPLRGKTASEILRA